jgi:hypothetical protein
MKQAAETSPIVASNGLTSSVMGIDPANAARLTKFLRDSIYSDKVLAVVREYLCNAKDEHVKFDIKRPVETGIRNESSDYEFFVRDFAMGLSEQDVREIFGQYGSSTKRDNNSQVGQFGVGSGSGHSYSDTFFITSYHNGLKSSYSCVLGGDKDNVSVGHIYKINECPTAESGIEVVVPVKPADLSNFSNKIRDFVSVSPDNIVADIIGESVEPIKPSFEIKLGNYNMRVLEDSKQRFETLLFQMGGNTYRESDFYGHSGGQIKDGHIVVIDIPIGDCSVTLSRESFEQTSKNTLVFDEIEKLMQEYVANDMIQFKDKKILDLVGDSLSGLKKYESEAFSYLAQDIYSDCWDFVKSISLQGTGSPMMQNGKPVCIVIPKNGIRAHWKDKVANHLKTENLSAYVAQHGNYSSGEVDKAFHVVCARKVKYAKIARDGKRYVFKTGSRSFGTFSPLEFFNAVSDKLNWGIVAANQKEAVDFMTKKKADANYSSDLGALRISQSAGTYKLWSTQSMKMIDAVVALGFVADGGPEDRAIIDRIHKEQQEETRKRNMFSKAKKTWVVLSPLLQKAYNKEKNAEKVSKFWSIVMKEDSLRGKILSACEESYCRPRLERHELRRILKLV